MSDDVRKQLQLNASLPSGSKKPSRKSRGSKSKTRATTPSKTPPKSETVPAQAKAEPFDVEEAQNVVFKPNPGPQSNFLSASEREVLYGGSAGGGKSYAMLADPLHGLNNANFSGLLVRHTTEELRELIQKSQELYPKAVPGIKWSERKSQWTTPQGGRLWMSYLDKDTDVTRYQGQAFNWLGFDELTQWGSPYAWDYMRSRLRSAHAKELGLYMRATTNPGGSGHAWVKKTFIDPSPANQAFWATNIETGETIKFPAGHSKAGQPLFKRKFIPASLFDNPYLAESGDYEAMLLSLPEHQRKQLLEGNWDVNEGAAFPEFNRAIHVVDDFKIPHSWTKFRACDYGYGSMSAVLWLAVAPDEQLIVYRELYCSKVTATDLADMVLDAESEDGTIRYGVLDSSLWHNRGDTGPSLAEQMNMKGCRWRPSDRSRGSRVSGKNEIHRRLQVDEFTEKPRMVFMASCTDTIAQLPSIPLDKKNPEDVDTNSNDHGYDALRYAIMTRPRSSLWDYNPATQRSGFQISDKNFGY
ncbi:MAG: hypothetical protein GY820_27920 [Gammaproteobacteria bacterium]|nr:hypothetical protein [Gammaproteobacteria bacterium]